MSYRVNKRNKNAGFLDFMNHRINIFRTKPQNLGLSFSQKT